MRDYGDREIVLSSANTNSYDKQRMNLSRYMAEMVERPILLTDRADTTFYHFGDNDLHAVRWIHPPAISFLLIAPLARSSCLSSTLMSCLPTPLRTQPLPVLP